MNRQQAGSLSVHSFSSIKVGRDIARQWAAKVPDRRQQSAAWSFIAKALEAYVAAKGSELGKGLSVSPLSLALSYELEPDARSIAQAIGELAAKLPIAEASYQLSATYTVLLPEVVRGSLGIYYTPPALTERLLDMAQEAGVDWASARILDPACGGGAFLLPVALRLASALKGNSASILLDRMGHQLRGFEIDPFAAWMTQAWLEIAFADVVKAAGKSFPKIVQVCDSLEQSPTDEVFDLVVGNPPYGRVTLTAEQRERYKRSLYGHANLYGVFTDIALRWTRKGGIVAYVTPTSFLSGEYFKSLRQVLAKDAPPVAMDFINARRGVFEDVLQETALATYRKGARKRRVSVHFIEGSSKNKVEITHAGQFQLPVLSDSPWIAPRTEKQQALTDQLARLPDTLEDWGYTVSTGPLVWNRFKGQMREAKSTKACYPLIWAESVTSDGRFVFRAQKRNHSPYFEVRPEIDNWLKVSTPCVLVQRTTAKEQARRLIAAELPAEFIAKDGAVVVENHLNMVKPIHGQPKVAPALLAALLNSPIVDQAFRCISGSVAVSAFELEALPLPSVAQMRRLAPLAAKADARASFNAALEKIYTKAIERERK